MEMTLPELISSFSAYLEPVPVPASVYSSAEQSNPEKKPALLTSIEHRLKLISELGPDICLVAKFKKDFGDSL